MDSFAVSIAAGANCQKSKILEYVTLPISIGIFHVIMIYLGWYLGSALSEFIFSISHWVAFALLLVVGIKMIYESFEIKKAGRKIKHLTIPVIILLSIATSLDALAIGFSFSLLNFALTISVIVIGTITLIMSSIGVYIGHKIGHFFENRIEIFGGIILIGIGIKILLEHLL